MSESRHYQVVIIGGGPAGLTAAVYAARSRLSTVLLEKGAPGGRIVTAELVENYPGFPDGVNGLDLGELMTRQARKYGVEPVSAEVTAVEAGQDHHTVWTSDGDYLAGAVIVAGGAERVPLGVPGEQEFTGRGVSYCATCDAYFFQGKRVVVVGGGNAALNEALHLSKFAERVVVIHRRDELRATRILQERAFAEPKLEFVWNARVDAIEGEEKVKRVRTSNVVTGEKSALEADGVFVAVGFRPATDYLKAIVELDATGAIVTNDRMETSVRGIFAAGDIRANSVRQVVTAAGDGAAAAVAAEAFLAEKTRDKKRR